MKHHSVTFHDVDPHALRKELLHYLSKGYVPVMQSMHCEHMPDGRWRAHIKLTSDEHDHSILHRLWSWLHHLMHTNHK